MSPAVSEYQEARALAERANLRIITVHGVYKVYRNTIPRLTFIGSRVNAKGLLELVRHAAGSRVPA